MADSGRKTKLTERTIERTESPGEVENLTSSRVGEQSPGAAPPQTDGSDAVAGLIGANGAAPAGDREGPLPKGESGAPDEADPATTAGTRSEARRMRRAARGRAERRPRAPRSERGAVTATAAGDSAETTGGAEATAEAEADAPVVGAPALNLAGSSKRGARTVRRARKKQQAAADAVKSVEDNPALGALNRHLNMMMQQLNTAHRVIGRVAAERDALRQQLADLQGIPVEEIVVSTIGAAPESSSSSAKSPQPSTPAQSSALARLNYFGGDDFAVMKKRRQAFALVIVFALVVIWLASRMGAIPLPTNVSRESLGTIPLIGDLITVFLAGWILFRVVKVSSKGVRWVFPSDNQRRRRR